MKPKRIILVRHGESVGNVNRAIYDTVPDYAIKLTEKGHEQAKQAGVKIANIIGAHETACAYVSSYTRTKQTFHNIAGVIGNQIKFTREDPRLREQEWRGNLGSFDDTLEDERDKFGFFFYRFPVGESCADVYDRMSSFLDTLFRDFEHEDYPDNAIIVSHGMAMRVFLMRWFNLPVEQFELLRNPKNCAAIVLEFDVEVGKYRLTEELAAYAVPTHPYHFPL